MAYVIVALVIAEVTDSTLSVLLDEKIFKPLGMTKGSMSWDADNGNVAKSYQTLEDLSPYEVTHPPMGGSLIEAAGGLKSTIHDLLILYKAFITAANPEFESETDTTEGSIFKQSGMIVFMHTSPPGVSPREKSYAAVGLELNFPVSSEELLEYSSR